MSSIWKLAMAYLIWSLLWLTTSVVIRLRIWHAVFTSFTDEGANVKTAKSMALIYQESFDQGFPHNCMTLYYHKLFTSFELPFNTTSSEVLDAHILSLHLIVPTLHFSNNRCNLTRSLTYWIVDFSHYLDFSSSCIAFPVYYSNFEYSKCLSSRVTKYLG